MRTLSLRFLKLLRSVRDFCVAMLVFTFYALVRALPAQSAIRGGGKFAQFIGRFAPRSKIALRNIALAFPEKSPAEHQQILSEAWDNFGRTAVEYCHLDHIWDYDINAPGKGHINVAGVEHFVQMRDDGKPALIVTAHLGNWELPMVAANVHGLKAAALFRAPNNRWIAKWVLNRRKVAMGELIASRRGSIHALSNVIERGDHLGMLVDQHFWNGVESTLFGRKILCNPAFARLARLHDCPVYAVRVIRLPNERFRIELTPELQLPRDETGKIDIKGSIDFINCLFETWIAEHPGQWLWLHRRWRG
ncbi:MAG: lipid A biosynthesis lauroyl acyltransferase [Pseudomonadota bacterium]